MYLHVLLLNLLWVLIMDQQLCMVIKLDMQHVILPINMWKRPFHFLFMTNTPCHSMFQLLSILLSPIISMIHINLAMPILIISKAHMRGTYLIS